MKLNGKKKGKVSGSKEGIRRGDGVNVVKIYYTHVSKCYNETHYLSLICANKNKQAKQKVTDIKYSILVIYHYTTSWPQI